MTLWLRNNIREGLMRPISMPAVRTVSRERILNGITGLVAQRTRVKCVPKPAMRRLAPHLRSGDLIFFVSTRKNLDVFHAGIIVRDGKSIRMRHASLSQSLVVEQELGEFLRANRMAGVIVMRPYGGRDAPRLASRMTRLSMRRVPSSQRSDSAKRQCEM
jgi:hypothetical protein